MKDEPKDSDAPLLTTMLALRLLEDTLRIDRELDKASEPDFLTTTLVDNVSGDCLLVEKDALKVLLEPLLAAKLELRTSDDGDLIVADEDNTLFSIPTTVMFEDKSSEP